MNIQHFSLSALENIMMDEHHHETSVDDDNHSDAYDDSGAYEEDFEHESQVVSMNKDQGNDISVIPQSSDGDGSVHDIYENRDPDNDRDDDNPIGEEDLLEVFRKRQVGNALIAA